MAEIVEAVLFGLVDGTDRRSPLWLRLFAVLVAGAVVIGVVIQIVARS